MAELPRYNKLGIQFQPVANMNLASVEEAIRSAQSMDSRIDQLNKIILKEGEKAAIKKGQEFAAENPVTYEQMKAAMLDEEGLSSLLPSGAGSIFTESYYKSQAALLSGQLQVEASDFLTALEMNAAEGRIDYSTANYQIREMIDGYSAAVNALDPDFGYKLKATLATKGNGSLQKVANYEVDRFKAANKAGFLKSLPKLENNLINLYSMKPEELRFLPDKNRYQTFDEAADFEIQTLLPQAMLIGSDSVAELYKLNESAKVSAITNSVGADKAFATDRSLISAIDSNQLGQFQSIWDGLSEENRDKVRKDITERMKLQNQRKEQLDKQQRRQLEQRRAVMQKEIQLSGPSMDFDQRLELYNEMMDANRITDGEDIYNPKWAGQFLQGTLDDGGATEGQMAFFYEALRGAQLTPIGVNALFDGGVINGKQKQELDNFFDTRAEKDNKTNLNFIKTKVLSDMRLGEKQKKTILRNADTKYLELVEADPERILNRGDLRDQAIEFAYNAYDENAANQLISTISDRINSQTRAYFKDEFLTSELTGTNGIIQQLVDGLIEPEFLFKDPESNEAKNEIKAIRVFINSYNKIGS